MRGRSKWNVCVLTLKPASSGWRRIFFFTNEKTGGFHISKRAFNVDTKKKLKNGNAGQENDDFLELGVESYWTTPPLWIALDCASGTRGWPGSPAWDQFPLRKRAINHLRDAISRYPSQNGRLTFVWVIYIPSAQVMIEYIEWYAMEERVELEAISWIGGSEGIL